VDGFRRGLKYLKIQQKTWATIFYQGTQCSCEKIEEADPSTFFRQMTAGKNVSLWGGKTVWMPRLYQFLTADFK
jgi:hypothetical protein